MKFFRFFPDCLFICGPAGSAIYALSHRKTYRLSPEYTQVIKKLHDGDSLEQIEATHPTISQQVFDWLVDQHLGAFHESPVVIEHYEPKSAFELRGYDEPPPMFHLVYIQVSDTCDANCQFCNNGAFLSWQGCNSCMRWPRQQEGIDASFSLNALDEVIDDLANYDLSKIILSGGNPLIEFNAVTNLARKIREVKPEIAIEVFTNGRHFNEEVVSIAKELNLEFGFSVFGTNESDYALATGTPELYNELCNAMSLCREADIKYDLTLVVSVAMREEYERFSEKAKSMGGRMIFTTEVLPREGNRPGIVSFSTGSRRVEDIDSKEFFQRRKYNFCMNGKIAIAADGSLLPCPVWSTPIGNINTEQNLRYLFSSRDIEKYWKATKDTVEICKDCENRYACVDCSLVEREMSEYPEAIKHICNYDMVSGKWLEKTESV